MSGPTRHARVRAFAKINLDLRVLHRRPDGYHELRTVLQTISLADRLDISFTPARTSAVRLEASRDIPDNLAVRAAYRCLDQLRLTAHIDLRLEKTIPMGAGLGGGSSDAAAVLLALPVLAGRSLPLADLIALARDLGSDVPFFLLGGCAVGLGRGTEIYPLPDFPARRALLIVPGIHVSTAQAYHALRRGQLTTDAAQNSIDSFQGFWWGGCRGCGGNDFEATVFHDHPELGLLKRRLEKLGADVAMMSGSGSSIFGIFRTPSRLARAWKSFRKEQVFSISLVGRARYRSCWSKWLAPHTTSSPGGVWPLRSRYVR